MVGWEGWGTRGWSGVMWDPRDVGDGAMGSQGTSGIQGMEQWEHPATQDATVMEDNKHQATT